MLITYNKSQDKFLNYKKLNKLARKQQWHSILSIQDPDIATNKLIELIKMITEKAQTKKRKYNDNNMPRKKWITEGIMNSCKTKEILYNMWKANPDDAVLEQNYKKYDKVHAKVIKNAKYSFEQKNVEKCGRDSKKLWNYINKSINITKNDKKRNINRIKDNDLVFAKPQDIANSFNSLFGNVGKNRASQIKKPKNVNLTLPDYNENTLFLEPINQLELLKIIKQMKNKAGGIDEINVMVLKNIARYIVNPLTHY